MNVYFWHNIPSPHLAPAYRRLADIWPGEVHWVCHQADLAERRNLGWSPPDTGNLGVTVLNGDMARADDIIQQSCRGIHLIAAFERTFQTLPHAMQTLCDCGCPNLGIMAERGDPRGVRGILRFLLHALKARRYRPNVKMVLAMGTSGVEYFTRAGFSDRIVFPYMYQLDGELDRPDTSNSRAASGNTTKLIYVGQFIPLKGVDLLLKALGAIRSRNWCLTVVGAGPEEAHLRGLAGRVGVNDKVQWLGRVSSSHVGELLGHHDVCVCPSRYDGWCMVVSEAIDAGIGVIATEAVGARDVVKASGAGIVIPSDSVTALQQALEDVLAQPQTVPQWKEDARRYRHCLAGEAVGDYLAKVLNHVFLNKGPRPDEPWILKTSS